jgi:hypothetical protein
MIPKISKSNSGKSILFHLKILDEVHEKSEDLSEYPC